MLSILCFFASCSSDDDNTNNQDYTSFTIMQDQIETQPNTLVGYYKDGLCKKIAEIGDLNKGVESREITVNGKDITSIYVFSDYPNPSYKLDTVFVLKNNQKNKFYLGKKTKAIKVDSNDTAQYPH